VTPSVTVPSDINLIMNQTSSLSTPRSKRRSLIITTTTRVRPESLRSSHLFLGR